MVDFVQKQVLDPASFSNANTNAIDAVKVRVDAGSVVGVAIASAVAGVSTAPTGAAGGGLTGTYPNPGLSAAAVIAAVPAATDTVQGKVELATVAEATAGTSTTLAVTPAGVAAAVAAGVASVTIPDATDAVKGKVALAVGANYPQATNDVDAVTPAYVAAAIAAAPTGISTGTFAGVGAPTAAPTAGQPTTLTNANGEVFDWTGSAWVLVGNGYFENKPQTSAISLPIGLYVSVQSVSAPRAGRVLVTAAIVISGTTPGDLTLTRTVGAYLKKNGAFASRLGVNDSANFAYAEFNGAWFMDVVAGDVITLDATSYSVPALVSDYSGQTGLQIQYIK